MDKNLAERLREACKGIAEGTLITDVEEQDTPLQDSKAGHHRNLVDVVAQKRLDALGQASANDATSPNKTPPPRNKKTKSNAPSI